MTTTNDTDNLKFFVIISLLGNISDYGFDHLVKESYELKDILEYILETIIVSELKVVDAVISINNIDCTGFIRSFPIIYNSKFNQDQVFLYQEYKELYDAIKMSYKLKR